jgi:TonB-dependent SusC/RagA subfamily outer membrane receptor
MKLKIFSLLLLSAFLITIPVSGQKVWKHYFLSGKVTDSTGMPVSGAMILIDKNNTNVMTDSKGIYKVRIKSSARKITVFSFSGKAVDAEINGRRNVNFTIEGASESAVDVPPGDENVNIGYGNVKSRDLVGPVNKLETTDTKFAGYTNIYDMIRGRIPGVEVKGNSIRIQGANSFIASTEPLLVVDGQIVPSIDYINPVDVKSIEVLKGASATIYGSRGANGVILISLKGAGNH